MGYCTPEAVILWLRF